jgi:predicted RNA binding protein YcfA (HicA-like mRNA interferase family)
VNIDPIQNRKIYVELDIMKIRTMIRILEDDGWYLTAQKGSHQQYKHPVKPGRVTIAGHPAHDLAIGTEKMIMKQAGLETKKEGRS